jgi:hypothetical protein
MTNTRAIRPPVSQILDEFFSDYKHVATPVERRRIALVRRDLIANLDAEGWRVLDDSQTAIFDVERHLKATGAFIRVAHAPELFSALAHYASPVHSQVGIDQRVAQLDVIEALVRMLWKSGYLLGKSVCAHCKRELDTDIRKGRDLVREARAREQILAR